MNDGIYNLFALSSVLQILNIFPTENSILNSESNEFVSFQWIVSCLAAFYERNFFESLKKPNYNNTFID